ncbi:hypothetical protein NPIL_150211 [Nephila pilipes]|uniref:Uncharacterized protein n=1 Tax=Nephila pilipes TaxID=299642 RepID=A0A8X6PW04_NEPPI|nr:hypothetical protein NPIL_150211 [Nephila pilipes]
MMSDSTEPRLHISPELNQATRASCPSSAVLSGIGAIHDKRRKHTCITTTDRQRAGKLVNTTGLFMTTTTIIALIPINGESEELSTTVHSEQFSRLQIELIKIENQRYTSEN